MKQTILVLPVTGKPALSKTLDSLQQQTEKEFSVLVVVNGKDNRGKVHNTIIKYLNLDIEKLSLPTEIANSEERIHHAFSFLLDNKIVYNILEGVVYEPNFIEQLLKENYGKIND